eukprot:5285466-Pyramimonas_sp.AAC.1
MGSRLVRRGHVVQRLDLAVGADVVRVRIISSLLCTIAVPRVGGPFQVRGRTRKYKIGLIQANQHCWKRRIHSLHAGNRTAKLQRDDTVWLGNVDWSNLNVVYPCITYRYCGPWFASSSSTFLVGRHFFFFLASASPPPPPAAYSPTEHRLSFRRL